MKGQIPSSTALALEARQVERDPSIRARVAFLVGCPGHLSIRGPPVHPAHNHLRAKLANVCRNHPEDAEAADELRRELKYRVIADDLAERVEAEPALSPEQRQGLALLLLGEVA